MSKRLKILAVWPPGDFVDFFTPAFLGRDDLEVEIVCGNGTHFQSRYTAGYARTRELRKRLEAGEFDLVVAGNVYTNRWPDHKGFFTRLSVALRYSTIKRDHLDVILVPELLRGLSRPVPLAALDMRDAHFIRPWELPLLRASTLYFKRELFAWHVRSLEPLMTWKRAKEIRPLEQKLRPMSYGIDPARIPASARPMAERDIDLFISGGGNPVRDEIKKRCEALVGTYRVVVAQGKVSEAEYVDLLQRSKLVVCTESHGCETWRQYEVAAAGGVPLINYPFVLHHQPMEPDEHAIFFSLAGRDFEKQIERALKNPALLQAISIRTREWTLTHKPRPRIADYVIAETLKEHQRLYSNQDSKS